MMNSDYLALLALLVSIASLTTTLYYSNRDKVKLRASSKYYPYHPEYSQAYMEISIVNHGRRPTVLTLFGGDLKDGGWQGTGLSKNDAFLRLGEHEFHKVKFYKEDIFTIAPDSESEYIALWFEDSLGNRHIVKNSARHIKELLKT